MRTLGLAITLATLSLPTSAFAEGTSVFEKYGTSVSFGGGVVQFLSNKTRGYASEGGALEARLAFRTKRSAVLEVGYLGSLHRFDALGVDRDAHLRGTTIESTLRVNRSTGRIQPYWLVGAGWAHYDLTRTTATVDVGDHDNIAVVLFGLGVALRKDDWLLDARAVYRASEKVDMFAENDFTLDSWSATLRVGFEY